MSKGYVKLWNNNNGDNRNVYR